MKAEKYIEEMNELVKGCDTEADHGGADNLLCEVIRVLIKRRKDKGVWEEVLKAYDRVEKWYS